MRSTNDIIEAVQNSEEVSNDELCLALLVTYYTGHQVNDQLMKLTEFFKKQFFPTSNALFILKKQMAEDAIKNRFNAMTKDPQEYLGPEWTPGNPVHDSRRKGSLKMWEAFKKSKHIDD